MKRLTLKQRRFVKQYIKNKGNGTKAALEVYDTKNAHVAQSIATENLSKPVIKETIEDAMKKEGITSSLILGQISNISSQLTDKWSGDTILKANIELLKLMGAYPGSKHSNLNINVKGNIKDLNFGEVKDELKVIDTELDRVMNDVTQEDPITNPK